MQGKLFQTCTHFLYCSALSLGGKVNTRRTSKPDMESIFTKIIYKKYSGLRKLLCEFSKLSDTDAYILVYKFRPERTGFNMYAEYTQLRLNFIA